MPYLYDLRIEDGVDWQAESDSGSAAEPPSSILAEHGNHSSQTPLSANPSVSWTYRTKNPMNKRSVGAAPITKEAKHHSHIRFEIPQENRPVNDAVNRLESLFGDFVNTWANGTAPTRPLHHKQPSKAPCSPKSDSPVPVMSEQASLRSPLAARLVDSSAEYSSQPFRIGIAKDILHKTFAMTGRCLGVMGRGVEHELFRLIAT